MLPPDGCRFERALKPGGRAKLDSWCLAFRAAKSAPKPRPAETPLPGIGERGRGAGENVGAPLLRWGADASGEEGSGVCQDQAGSEHNAQTAQEITFPWSQARQARIQVSIGIIFGFGPATPDLVRWSEACVTATPATRVIIIVNFSHCFIMCVSPLYVRAPLPALESKQEIANHRRNPTPASKRCQALCARSKPGKGESNVCSRRQSGTFQVGPSSSKRCQAVRHGRSFDVS